MLQRCSCSVTTSLQGASIVPSLESELILGIRYIGYEVVVKNQSGRDSPNR